MTFDRISIIRLEYIGLPTAAVIASNGIRVLGFDINHHASIPLTTGKSTLLNLGSRIWFAALSMLAI